MGSGILSRRYLAPSIAIYTTVSLVAFEGSAVAAALPPVAGDLGRLELLPWVITSYLFASGVATVVAGPMVDTLGTRVVFRWAVAVFTAAGFGAGLATTMPALVVVRLIQGAGAGLLVAVALAAVSLVYPDELTGRAFAANSTVWGMVGAAAPAIAGLMLTTLSWRWLFYVNLPLGLLALVAGWRVLPGPAAERSRLRIDGWGVLLAGVFTLAGLLAVDRISPLSFVWLGVAGLAAAGYLLHTRRSPDPLVRREHLLVQPYSTLAAGTALLVAPAFGVNIYITLYVTAGRGGSLTLAAWSVFFFTIGWTTGANVTSRQLDRRSETALMLRGCLITIAGLGTTAAGSWAEAPLPVVLAGLAVVGFGIGTTTNAGLTLIRAMTDPAEIGRVSAAHQFARNQGFTIGSALGGATMLFVVARTLGGVEPVQRLLAGETEGITPAVATSVRFGYAVTAAACLVLSLTAVWPFVSLRRHFADRRRSLGRR